MILTFKAAISLPASLPLSLIAHLTHPAEKVSRHPSLSLRDTRYLEDEISRVRRHRTLKCLVVASMEKASFQSGPYIYLEACVHHKLASLRTRPAHES